MEKRKFEEHLLFGHVLPFFYGHFLENPYWSGPDLPHPSGPRWRQEEDWFIPPHLFPVLRRAVLSLTLITKSEGASHFSQGTIIQTMI